MGWAVGAGIKLFAPMIGQGDYVQAEVNYTEGADGYINAVARHVLQVQRRCWRQLRLRHLERQRHRRSRRQSFDDRVGRQRRLRALLEQAAGRRRCTAATALRATTPLPTRRCAVSRVASSAGTCNNNWSGLEHRYSYPVEPRLADLHGCRHRVPGAATPPTAAWSSALPANGTQAGGVRTFADQSALMGQFRIHRNFYP